MAGHQRERERGRLLDLAVDYGFDRDLAAAALARLVNVYGTAARLSPSFPPFELPSADCLDLVLLSCDELGISPKLGVKM